LASQIPPNTAIDSENPEAPPSFPSIYLSHKELQNIVTWGPDLTRVDVFPGADGPQWTLTKDEETPTNAAGILDIAPAVSHQGRGLYVLYKSHDAAKSKLYARYLRPNTDDEAGTTMTSMAMGIECPDGA
jgi:hypothetical protein